ncbi:MAG: DUF3122 domain-containing protein [Chroococcales cyanobacterium]
MRSLLSLLLSLILCCVFTLSYALPTMALVRQQEEAPGQMLYQSRHTLKDDNRQTWQLVLFKRVKKNVLESINLRLVGFPGVANFTHPDNLILKTKDGKTFIAPDSFAEESPSPNVGQYDIAPIISELPANQSVELILPLESASRRIQVPYPIVLEWQTLAQEVEKSSQF